MTAVIASIESTELFVGTIDDPRQVVRVLIERVETAVVVRLTGDDVTGTSQPTEPNSAGSLTVEVPIAVAGDRRPGRSVAVKAEVEQSGHTVSVEGTIVLAEPGWTMFMVPHFHFDPVWWNTQAAFTSAWDELDFEGSPRQAFQQPTFDLVRAHLAVARRDPDYCFVLAEADYLKPYWDRHPEDRVTIRRLMLEGRLELMGGTWNEPNTNLTSAETTARNIVYGIGLQRDILGGDPATAWQLDAFGHDPQFPALVAAAGLTSTSWARGPFHTWGPMLRTFAGEPTTATVMQFPSEFEWIAPGGEGVTTAFMANHYSAGFWLDEAPDLDSACEAAYKVYLGLKAVAATRNVLLPTGTDHAPPNRWVTEIHREWGRRYVWPRFRCAVPRDFFAAVTAELADRGERLTPQTRDMNPVCTGKDVSYIDTKQAQRMAESTLLDAEKWATLAALDGAEYPDARIDRAWRQLVFGAHHDAITGTESDQVYLDLLTVWREALTIAHSVRDEATRHLAVEVGCAPALSALTVFNSLNWERSDPVCTTVTFDHGVTGFRLVGADGEDVPVCFEVVDRRDDGTLRAVTFVFVAVAVPALGYRTWAIQPADDLPAGSSWTAVGGSEISNEHYSLVAQGGRGGGLVSVVEVATGRELVAADALANEIVVYDEYPDHPEWREGPWHLLPRGTSIGSGATTASVVAEVSAIGRRLRIDGGVGPAQYRQTITLLNHRPQIDFEVDVDWTGSDQLIRVRFPMPIKGSLAVSEVGNAVIGRGFAFPDVDAAEHPWTLDNPCFTWFASSATGRVRLGDRSDSLRPPLDHAVGTAEIVAADPGATQRCRELATALVKVGVTATTSVAGGSRCGDLDVDSNLPDFRISIGGPDVNAFTAEVLGKAPPGYRTFLIDRLRRDGRARVWVPAARPLADVWRPDADLRSADMLPVLIVAGSDATGMDDELTALVADLDDAVIDIDQPASLHPDESFDGHSVAVLNRGTPGFAVDAAGTLHLSLLRSCTGWPSSEWIDPPQRFVPDGSGFELQHWTHRFHYALVSGQGDWRDRRLVLAGHAYNHQLHAIQHAGVGGRPAAASMMAIEPTGSVIVTAIKPGGDPLSSGDPARSGDIGRVAVRAYEPHGRLVNATFRAPAGVGDVALADLLDRPTTALGSSDGSTAFPLRPASIVTLVGDLRAPRPVKSRSSEVPTSEQPSNFARYWLHNSGATPIGAQPVSLHLHGPEIDGERLIARCTIASCLRSDLAEGEVEISAPPGWRATPERHAFSIEPGHFVSLAIELTRPQRHGDAPQLLRASTVDRTGQPAHDNLVIAGDALHALVDVELATTPIDLRTGDTVEIPVRVRSRAAGALDVELSAISPFDAWRLVEPSVSHLQLAPLEERSILLAVGAPLDHPTGSWWLLVKTGAGGHVTYSPTVSVHVTRPLT